eukprot:SAG22_NODE_513_length_9567_cov_25.867771_9_plen_211_part_00
MAGGGGGGGHEPAPLGELGVIGQQGMPDVTLAYPEYNTGRLGRGLLGRWGPNRAVDVIVTRLTPGTWSRTATRDICPFACYLKASLFASWTTKAPSSRRTSACAARPACRSRWCGGRRAAGRCRASSWCERHSGGAVVLHRRLPLPCESCLFLHSCLWFSCSDNEWTVTTGLGRSTRSFAACMLPAAPERAAGQPADAGRDRRHRPGRAL